MQDNPNYNPVIDETDDKRESEKNNSAFGTASTDGQILDVNARPDSPLSRGTLDRIQEMHELHSELSQMSKEHGLIRTPSASTSSGSLIIVTNPPSSIRPEENEPKTHRHHFHHDLHHKPHIGDKHDLTHQETIQAVSSIQKTPMQAQTEVLEASENKKEQSIINTSLPVLPSPLRPSVPYQDMTLQNLPIQYPQLNYQPARQQGPPLQYQLTAPTYQVPDISKTDNKEESSSDSASSEESDSESSSESDCDSRAHDCRLLQWRKRQEDIRQMQQAYVQAECDNLINRPTMRTSAFIPNNVDIFNQPNSYNYNSQGAACIDCEDDELDEGVAFSYKPQPNGRTEMTITVEPKKQQQQWLTMMRCGFRPLINCTAPPCSLRPPPGMPTGCDPYSQYPNMNSYGGYPSNPYMSQKHPHYPSQNYYQPMDSNHIESFKSADDMAFYARNSGRSSKKGSQMQGEESVMPPKAKSKNSTLIRDEDLPVFIRPIAKVSDDSLPSFSTSSGNSGDTFYNGHK